MAKGSIKLTCKKCGKTFIQYNTQGTKEFLEWAAANIDLCPDCYKAEKSSEREASRESVAEMIPILEKFCPLPLPELQGSEKQIAWARKIRAEFINRLWNMNWDMAIEIANNPPPAADDEEGCQLKAEINKFFVKSAGWWIENRDEKLLTCRRREIIVAKLPPEILKCKGNEKGKPAYDRPLPAPKQIAPAPISAKPPIAEIRRAVCIEAGRLMRLGYDRACSMRSAWDKAKAGKLEIGGKK
jgi:hypothetical protein